MTPVIWPWALYGAGMPVAGFLLCYLGHTVAQQTAESYAPLSVASVRSAVYLAPAHLIPSSLQQRTVASNHCCSRRLDSESDSKDTHRFGLFVVRVFACTLWLTIGECIDQFLTLAWDYIVKQRPCAAAELDFLILS